MFVLYKRNVGIYSSVFIHFYLLGIGVTETALLDNNKAVMSIGGHCYFYLNNVNKLTQ